MEDFEFKFRNNPNLRPLGQNLKLTEWHVKEIIKCMEDPIYFIESYCYITDLDLGISKIKLREYQRNKVLPGFINHRFSLFLQCRQSGKSVLAGLYLLHQAIFNSDYTIVYLGNKSKIASEQLLRIKIAFERLPQFLKPGIKHWAITSIELENNSRIFVETTSETSSRGFSINLLVLDEFAFVRPNIQRSFIASVYPTIVASKTSKIAILSTLPLVKNKTELEENLFWRFRQSAIAKKSQFHYVQVDSHEIPGRDAKFKAETIENLGGDAIAVLTYAVEFENKLIFSSAKKLINPDAIQENSKYLMTPIEILSLEEYEGFFISIFEKYRPNGYYVMGVDSGKGVQSDYSVINLLRYDFAEKKFYQVANFYSNTVHPTKIYPYIIFEILKLYNFNVMLSLETNELGYAVLEKLDEILEEKEEAVYYVNLGNSKPEIIGVRTTSIIRSYMMLDLKGKMEIEQNLIIRNKRTLDEIDTVFENSRGKFEGIENDDEFLSICLALLAGHPEYRDILKDESYAKHETPIELGKSGGEILTASDLASLMF